MGKSIQNQSPSSEFVQSAINHLGTEHYCYVPDLSTPIDEAVRAADAVADGLCGVAFEFHKAGKADDLAKYVGDEGFDQVPRSLLQLALQAWRFRWRRIGGQAAEATHEAAFYKLRDQLQLLIQGDEKRAAAVRDAIVTMCERAGTPRRNRMSCAVANVIAMDLVKKMGKVFFALSEREQAKQIGCSWKTWVKTPFFEEAQKRQPAKPSRPSSPRTESLSAGREAVVGEGGRNKILNDLIAEQRGDQEPSPLESDPPGRFRRTHFRKRL